MSLKPLAVSDVEGARKNICSEIANKCRQMFSGKSADKDQDCNTVLWTDGSQTELFRPHSGYE